MTTPRPGEEAPCQGPTPYPRATSADWASSQQITGALNSRASGPASLAPKTAAHEVTTSPGRPAGQNTDSAMQLRLLRPHAGAHTSHSRRPPRVEVAASLPFDPKGRRMDGMPAFPLRPPGLSAPPTPTPGAASVTQLGSHPPTERTSGSPANTWVARKHVALSGQARSIPAWSPPGSHSHAAHPAPRPALPLQAGLPPQPGSWEQGGQPKLLGTEPRAPCFPSRASAGGRSASGPRGRRV